MFADDLILITEASRVSARNCLLYLNLFQDLTAQRPNLHKSAIYIPSWCNKNLSNSISRILGISLGSFPFTYLGIPFSPKILLINQLQHIPHRVNNAIHSWNHSSISIAGKVTLLSGKIFSIPNCILPVMHLPNTILNQISKTAQNFLWGRTNNNRAFHSVGWTFITLSKSKGGFSTNIILGIFGPLEKLLSLLGSTLSKSEAQI